MSLQPLLLSLKEITYSGANLGVNFTVNITANSESNSFQLALAPGGTTQVGENVGGGEADFGIGAFNFPVAASVSGNNFGAPIHGSASTTFIVPPAPSDQFFNLVVPISSGIGGSATLVLRYHLVFREYPVSYNPEWLCRNRYNWSAFHRWLCLGAAQLPNFATLPEVLSLQQLFLDNTARLQRFSNELSLGFSPAGTSFADTLTFVSNVMEGTALWVDTLKMGRRFTLDDFSEAVEAGMENYMVAVHTSLDPQVMELCKRWRELLDCFCRFCSLRPTLPIDAVAYYDSQVAPQIDGLYGMMTGIAAGENMPAGVGPSTISVNCDKLRYIVSFWAWWCRRCDLVPLFMPVWEPSIDPYYTVLYDKRAFLNDILEANNLTLCNPPEKNFCTRWLSVLNCLQKLCANKAYLSGATNTDIESTFGASVRSLASFLNLPGIGSLMAGGISNTCALIDKLSTYFNKLCPQGVVPAPRVRRTQLDSMLTQFENAVNGFQTRNGNLCASSTPMTDCTTWTPIIDCLERLCNGKSLLTDELKAAILSSFTTVIGDLFTIAFATPPVPPPGTAGIDLLCFKLSHFSTFFGDLCPGGSVDPIVKLRLDAKLAALQAAHAALLDAFPSICDTTVTVPPTWCNPWSDILECLKRLCERSDSLDPDVIDEAEDQFGGEMDVLVWIASGAVGAYTPGNLTFAEICAELEDLLAFLNDYCTNGSMDPILKLRLDQELETLQNAYNNFTGQFPGICAVPDDFCQEWIETLDCLVRIFDRWVDNPGDTRVNNAMMMIADGATEAIEDTYLSVFGSPAAGSFATDTHKLGYEMHALLDWFVQECACCGGVLGVEMRAELAAVKTALDTAYDGFVDCDPSCEVSSLNLTTGSAPWVVTRVDNVTLGTPVPANVVTGTSGLGSPVTGSDWLSPHATGADNVIGYTTFQRCFCVCTSGTIDIDFEYLVDDYGDVFLDDVAVYHASTSHMHASETVSSTISVTAGRHCLRVEAYNNPTINMAFCGAGSITAVTATLLDDDCCTEGQHPLALCDDIRTPCDRVSRLLRIQQFLCCPARIGGDPFFATTQYSDILEGLICFENDLPQILYALGDEPASYPYTSNDFCIRMRRAVRVMLFGYFNFGRLPALYRWKIECFYNLLRAKVSELVIARQDNPLPCGDACDICTRWLDLIDCLCKLCAMRPELAFSHPTIAGQLDDLLCYDDLGAGVIGYPLVYAAQEAPDGASCCDRLEFIVRQVAERCFCCTESPGYVGELQTSYNWLSAQYAPLGAAVTAAGLVPCRNICTRWRDMLVCLAGVCLRRHELSQALRDSFDTRFTTKVTALATAVFNTTPAPSPFVSDVFGTTCWSIVRLVEQFDWLCTPFAVWQPGLEATLKSTLDAFVSQYDAYMSELGAAGNPICSQVPDPCERLRRLTDAYRTICGSTPNLALAPIVAINTALAQIAPLVAGIQKQLGLPIVVYPTSDTFCSRLYFVVKLVGTAYARYNELALHNRVMVDLFDAIMRRQGEMYSWGIGDQLPRPVTEMEEYRAQWMELLVCICRTCEWVAGLSPTDRTTYHTIVDMVENPASDLSAAIASLYTAVIALSGTTGVPMVSDTCATTTCAKLRIVIGFFAVDCLGCDVPESAVVTALASLLDPLRAATADLRSALMIAGQNVCGVENLDPVVLQSPALYVQAAGSRGFDGSATGVHLRWTLLNELGDHIPKANLARPGTSYYGTNPYNKKDDYVKIFRAPYRLNDRFVAEIDLLATAPTRSAGDDSVGVQWVYENIAVDQRFPDVRTTISVTLEPNSYPPASLPVPPTPTAAHVQGVINAYGGLYRVEAMPKLAFACEVVLQGTPPPNAAVRFEAVSQNDDLEADDSEFLTCRQEVTSLTNTFRIESENVDHVLFTTINGKLRKVRIETYDDFYIGSKRRYLWKKLGLYGLETDTTKVMLRLHDPVNYPIDNSWPKYETATGDGSGRVNIQNYADRWVPGPTYGRNALQSLRGTLLRYLDESKSSGNVEAWIDQDVIDAEQKTVLNISLLHMLMLAAQDYHLARMLGLGTIDWQVPLSGDAPDQRYIYYAEYEAAPAPGAIEAPTTHRFLTLPTGRADERLPVMPEIDSVQFGLDPAFTDSQGYTVFGGSRFIRIYKKAIQFDLPVDTFFGSSARFSRGTQTRPILFGIKYGTITVVQGGVDTTWVFPDPSNDDAEFVTGNFLPYRDHANHPEIAPIPESKDIDGVVQPLFTHMVENKPEHQGKHIYGIYGINWFGRPSAFNPGPTVINTFPVRNTLQPPANLTSQYILDEDPPIFISESERDPAFWRKTRVTFDWSNAQEEAYHRANAVDLYFRPTDPLKLQGAITSTTDSGSFMANTVDVHTTSYTDTSKASPLTIAPAIEVADMPKFVGSHFVTPSNKFEIVRVQRDGSNNAILTVKLIQQIGTDGQPIANTWIKPKVNDLFLVVENVMGVDEVGGYMAGWRRLTSHRIQLTDFTASPFNQAASYEQRTIDGKLKDVFIGGITSAACTIVKVTGNGLDGVYEVTIPTPLQAYSVQFPGVTWVDFYRGLARIKRSDGSIGSFDVLRITDRAVQTKIVVYDRENTISSLVSHAGQVWVNFHPGYRAYIDWSLEGSPYSEIEPAFPETSRLTYIAAKSVDTLQTSGSQPYRSGLTPPAVHLAHLQVKPETPPKPRGPQFATRPDIYGKSSYMLDTVIEPGRDNPPYGMLFLRADELAILSALYKQETIREVILPGLPAYDEDTHLAERWNGLLEVDIETGGSHNFKTYGSSPFRFPWPDRALDANDNGRYPEFDFAHAPDSIAGRIKDAICEAFLPLTETYVVYDHIKSTSLQTSSSKPVTRTPDGEPYDPSDHDHYDPYPMIRRGTLDTDYIVRFGDYTIDGAARNLYFYFVRELGNDLKFGEASAVLGPVRLINTAPPPAPQIKSVSATGENPAMRAPATVSISFNRYLPNEKIAKAVIYRTDDGAGAIAIRSMTEVAAVDLPTDIAEDEVYTVRDTFADLRQSNTPIPYGLPLYYRIVVQREIHNERGELEYVSSDSSEPVVVNIMDTVSPAPPVITPHLTVVPVDPPGDMRVGHMTDVSLEWNDSVVNGTYTLYKMSSAGQWVKLATFVPEPGRTVINQPLDDLPKLSDDGSEIFHRFKVMVINSSGLTNVREAVLRI